MATKKATEEEVVEEVEEEEPIAGTDTPADMEGEDTAEEGAVEADEKPAKSAKSAAALFKTLTKELGLKDSDLLSSNDDSLTAVYSNGGKYQISKNGKTIRHFSGPRPPEDTDLKVIDSRFRSVIGGAALLNRDPKE